MKIKIKQTLCALAVAASCSPAFAAADAAKLHDSLVVMDTHLDAPQIGAIRPSRYLLVAMFGLTVVESKRACFR